MSVVEVGDLHLSWLQQNFVELSKALSEYREYHSKKSKAKNGKAGTSSKKISADEKGIEKDFTKFEFVAECYEAAIKFQRGKYEAAKEQLESIASKADLNTFSEFWFSLFTVFKIVWIWMCCSCK